MPRTIAAKRRVTAPAQYEIQPRHSDVLEEVLEEASVTDLRNGLLPTIERIQKNPAIKVVIRKHGKRRAVLMSTATYDALMKVANLFMQANDRLSPQEKLEAAYQRMESSSLDKQPSSLEQQVAAVAGPVPIQANDVKVLLESAQQILRELDLRLGTNY